jgi:metal-responsive CopG/Arc/MetJ family transcriptional regulator
MGIISVRVDDELKKKMSKMRHINWSEYIRNAIKMKIEEEERLRNINRRRLIRAAAVTDSLRRKAHEWSGVAEIRRWREGR